MDASRLNSSQEKVTSIRIIYLHLTDKSCIFVSDHLLAQQQTFPLQKKGMLSCNIGASSLGGGGAG